MASVNAVFSFIGLRTWGILCFATLFVPRAACGMGVRDQQQTYEPGGGACRLQEGWGHQGRLEPNCEGPKFTGAWA